MARKGYRALPAVSGESEILKQGKGNKRSRRLGPDAVDANGVTVDGEERPLLGVLSRQGDQAGIGGRTL